MSAGHLVRRFVGSLSPRTPSAADGVWAETQLLDEEVELWRRMGRADRRHVIGVARRVEAALGNDATRPVLAAALLHDIGKLESHLSTYGRVVATFSIRVAGPEAAGAWTQTRGFTRRVGLYAQHEALGAEMLELAGSDPLTVALVREHSQPEPDRTAPAHLAAALCAADDA
ncbi:HD domain-containing protein [Iamia sp.]|uniref:HD domain-containing protein n=1 Tax=Iamia sp. TaxID=2722710 RepID=UPI002C03AA23|nr:HD domain-containing protein [Iamia sp.]HXH58331.1 HD domain-containing protein [Iamia sp.]